MHASQAKIVLDVQQRRWSPVLIVPLTSTRGAPATLARRPITVHPPGFASAPSLIDKCLPIRVVSSSSRAAAAPTFSTQASARRAALPRLALPSCSARMLRPPHAGSGGVGKSFVTHVIVSFLRDVFGVGFDKAVAITGARPLSQHALFPPSPVANPVWCSCMARHRLQAAVGRAFERSRPHPISPQLPPGLPLPTSVARPSTRRAVPAYQTFIPTSRSGWAAARRAGRARRSRSSYACC